MASWAAFEVAEPEMAARAAALFRRRKHHVMATVRADGSPRLSGTEVAIERGAFGFGVMAGAIRLADLRRDARLSLHSQGSDPPEHDHSAWEGEAKLSGRALSAAAPSAGADAPPGEYFVVDVDEVVITSIGSPADHLLIERWTPAGGRTVTRRY
ncbi:MAG: hypothetical protein RLZ14_376 [Actinomycetota bacterium]|jgi:hypothetical protein